jgi:hypothetical protein
MEPVAVERFALWKRIDHNGFFGEMRVGGVVHDVRFFSPEGRRLHHRRGDKNAGIRL